MAKSSLYEIIEARLDDDLQRLSAASLRHIYQIHVRWNGHPFALLSAWQGGKGKRSIFEIRKGYDTSLARRDSGSPPSCSIANWLMGFGIRSRGYAPSISRCPALPLPP